MSSLLDAESQKELKNTLFVTFFVFAMLTNVIGAVTNIFIKEYGLTLAEASLLNLSFFITYGLLSLPGGLLTHNYGYKAVFAAGVLLMSVGALFFGLVDTFPLLLIMSFVAGAGVTFIQVAANPLIQHAAPQKDFVKNINVIHSLFGLGSFIAPLAIMKLVENNISWRYFYFIIVVVSLFLFFSVNKHKIPKFIPEDFSVSLIFRHFRSAIIITSFIALFFYVGIEVGIAVWIMTYLETVKGVDPGIAVFFLSLFWLMLAIGRLVGGRLLKNYQPRTVVTVFCGLGAVSFALGLYGTPIMGMIFLPMVGFFLSVIFPTIYSVAIETEKHHDSVVSGILFTAVIGGAIIPYIIGAVGDAYGLTAGLSLVFLGFAVIFLKGLTIERAHVDLDSCGAEEI